MYLMTKGGNSSNDADYSEGEIERFYKKELAGQMGNLLARVTGKKMVKKLGDERLMFTGPDMFELEDEELVGLLKELPGKPNEFRNVSESQLIRSFLVDAFAQHLSTFEIHRSLSLLFDALAAANRHIQTLSPWLSTATPSEIHRSLYLSSEALRISGILLQPFMPTKSKVLLDSLGVKESDRGWEKAKFGQGGERGSIGIIKGGLWPQVELPTPTVSSTS
jgi:methionyl-tRNA synthetase